MQLWQNACLCRGRIEAGLRQDDDMVLGGLRIKLVRWGFVRRPFYVLSVMHKRSARNTGNRFEDVGWWDPNQAADGNMHLGLKMDRIKYWLTAGAIPTGTAQGLLEKAGVVPARPKPPTEKQRSPEDDLKWQSHLKQ